jgi:hypothetical protein
MFEAEAIGFAMNCPLGSRLHQLATQVCLLRGMHPDHYPTHVVPSPLPTNWHLVAAEFYIFQQALP